MMMMKMMMNIAAAGAVDRKLLYIGRARARGRPRAQARALRRKRPGSNIITVMINIAAAGAVDRKLLYIGCARPRMGARERARARPRARAPDFESRAGSGAAGIEKSTAFTRMGGWTYKLIRIVSRCISPLINLRHEI